MIVLDDRAAGMRIKFGDSYTCFLCALSSNCKGRAAIFAEKNMAFGISLIDFIGLAIIKHMAINSFTIICNSCKGVIKGNHDSGDEVTIVNRFKSYLVLKYTQSRTLPACQPAPFFPATLVSSLGLAIKRWRVSMNLRQHSTSPYYAT